MRFISTVKNMILSLRKMYQNSRPNKNCKRLMNLIYTKIPPTHLYNLGYGTDCHRKTDNEAMHV